MKSSHMLLGAVLLALGVLLLSGGAGAFAFLALTACMVMMGAMMWLMMRPRGGDRGDG